VVTAPVQETQENRIRLALIDDLGLFRTSLARFLASEPGFEVTGECATSAEALELLKSSTPDVVLLDFQVGLEPGTDFISAAKRVGYQGRFLIVAAALDTRKSALALKAGAAGIFLKSEPPERLVKAITTAADGGVWVDPKVMKLLADQIIDGSPFREAGTQISGDLLDERERNVLLGILSGLSNRRIGEGLGISESLVKNIVQRLFGKSGVRTRSQLVRVALEGSLGTPQELRKSHSADPASQQDSQSSCAPSSNHTTGRLIGRIS